MSAEESTADHGPRELDEITPNSARLYDYFLGGTHNFAADRELAEQILESAPLLRDGAQVNRSFLRRAVQFLVDEAGVDQFLDLGSGIPTVGNVHDIAQRSNPSARVVYVDYEPVAYRVATNLLSDNPNATIVQADLRDPAAVLNHPDTRRLLDFTRPVAVLLIGVLLFLDDDDHIDQIIADYREALASGSYLALAHPSVDPEVADTEVRAEIERMQAGYENASESFHVRSKAEIASWFTGTDLVAPGLVSGVDWHPIDPISEAERRASYGYVGIGRIP